MTVTVQGGTRLMVVDLYLSELGLGLSIIGDHDHITAPSFTCSGPVPAMNASRSRPLASRLNEPQP